MKAMYIDAQNVHKAIAALGREINWALFFDYSQKKFQLDTIKIFFGYLKQYESLYKKLTTIGYEVVFKDAMRLPDGSIKGNVDIDIAISALLDLFENGLTKAYLVSSDGDYNTLVKLFRERGVLGRVLIPSGSSASILLKKAAKADIQNLEDLKYFLEKKKNPD